MISYESLLIKPFTSESGKPPFSVYTCLHKYALSTEHVLCPGLERKGVKSPRYLKCLVSMVMVG